MENTISFNTKFGWISATEINNRITKIQFCRKKEFGKKSKNLKNIKKKIISFFQKKTNKLDAKILFNGNPIQKKIFAFFPFFITIILAPFAAGLILYWTMTNILTIIQQWIILRKTTVKTK